MSPTTRILIGLIAGLAAGAALPALGADVSTGAVRIIEPVGTLWVNGIRMVVLPMVVSLLVVSIGGTREVKTIGIIGRNAFLVCLAMLVGAGILVALVVPPLFAALPLNDASLAALRANAVTEPATQTGATGLISWISGLIPQNPVKAAADGMLLQLLIFTIFFGVALTRVSEENRAPVIAFFRGVADAMIVIVRWMLAVAPIGVFALAVPLAAKAGVGAAGALVYYLVAVAAVCILLIAVCSVVAATFGGISLRTFLRSAAPPQAVAFSSRSSLASLPALVESAEAAGFPKTVSSFFLPLAVSTFRLGMVPAMLIGSLFLARLYGIEIAPAQVVGIVLTSILLSFSVPGIPGGSILVMGPILAGAGIPAAGLGILLALDTVSDMFRTMTNVSGDFTAAALLSRIRGYKAT
jgi:proton glutamate symport protein